MSEQITKEKVVALALCFALTGCSLATNGGAVDKAREVCEPYGGVSQLWNRALSPDSFRVVCANGLIIEGTAGK